MMPVRAFAEDYIRTWEDGGSDDPSRTLSLDPRDPGNWTSGICGRGVCAGSQHGVTPAVLAAFRRCPVEEISEQTMLALDRGEAADIAVAGYYVAPGLVSLPWNQLAASIMDFGWNAGPRQAIHLLQRSIGVAEDGSIGALTTRAYQEWVASHSLEGAAKLWAATRTAYYQSLVTKRPVNQRFLHGWLGRTAYYEPDGSWWERFDRLP